MSKIHKTTKAFHREIAEANLLIESDGRARWPAHAIDPDGSPDLLLVEVLANQNASNESEA